MRWRAPLPFLTPRSPPPSGCPTAQELPSVTKQWWLAGVGSALVLGRLFILWIRNLFIDPDAWPWHTLNCWLGVEHPFQPTFSPYPSSLLHRLRHSAMVNIFVSLSSSFFIFINILTHGNVERHLPGGITYDLEPPLTIVTFVKSLQQLVLMVRLYVFNTLTSFVVGRAAVTWYCENARYDDTHASRTNYQDFDLFVFGDVEKREINFWRLSSLQYQRICVVLNRQGPSFCNKSTWWSFVALHK